MEGLFGGSRTISPEQTWTNIRPLLKDFGITRVGDITGLDRIGLPVWIAVRPNARTLSVSQGKGLTVCAAKVSAAMEALELAHAEQPRLAISLGTARDISASREVVDLRELPNMRASLFGTNTTLAWTPAREFKTSQTIWVPHEIVDADATIPRPDGAGCFLHTTNGLASGNTIHEAILHGLCEVIERDALAIWEATTDPEKSTRRINLDSIAASPARDIVQQILAAEVVPIVWDTTSDIGIATFRVALYDMTSDPVTRALPTGLGAGCHPDRMIAICRALTEAAQGRLTAIAGSRDDLGRNRYRSAQSAEALDSFRALAANVGQQQFTSTANAVFESVALTLEYVVTQIERAGLPRILTVDLSRSSSPISVARVIVPGLEGPIDSPSYLPGQRALATLARGLS